MSPKYLKRSLHATGMSVTMVSQGHIHLKGDTLLAVVTATWESKPHASASLDFSREAGKLGFNVRKSPLI